MTAAPQSPGTAWPLVAGTHNGSAKAPRSQSCR